MSDLNKTGKVVQTDDKGVERVFIYDDKFSMTSKKTETDPKKTKEKQEAEAKRLAEEKAAALAEKLAAEETAEAKRLEGEGEYKDGQKDGVWKFYDKEGIKEKEILFADGVDTLHTYYSSNGNKLKEGKMVDG